MVPNLTLPTPTKAAAGPLPAIVIPVPTHAPPPTGHAAANLKEEDMKNVKCFLFTVMLNIVKIN
jgi:hypothetical protein